MDKQLESIKAKLEQLESSDPNFAPSRRAKITASPAGSKGVSLITMKII